MRYALILAALAAVCFSAVAIAEPAYQWTRVAEVDAVEITVKEVTPVEMQEVEYRYLGPPNREFGLWAVRNVGFSVLLRRDDAFYCHIYVLDAEDAETIAHERRHCYGWTH